MNQALVLSIIIPVYNVESYINQCMESLMEIICFDEIEIIFVNDGSTDKSGMICDDYAKKYSNVSVIHQINKGLSVARNEGLCAAKGEYIMFVDSDDMLYGAVLRDNLNLLNGEYDILVYDWDTVSEDGVRVIREYKHEGIICGKYDSKKYIYYQIKESRYYWTIACQGIYKRSFLLSKQLYFESNIYHEDDLWFPQVILNSSAVYYMEKTIYKYRMRSNSITRDNHKNDYKHMCDIIYIYSYLYDFVKRNCEEPKVSKVMLGDISKRYLHAIYDYSAYKYEECCKKINKIQILNNCYLKDKFRCILLIMSDRLYYELMRSIKKMH